MPHFGCRSLRPWGLPFGEGLQPFRIVTDDFVAALRLTVSVFNDEFLISISLTRYLFHYRLEVGAGAYLGRVRFPLWPWISIATARSTKGDQ